MALTLRTAVGRTTPLTNIELDGNFTYLETQSNLRLVITDYNYSTILERLNGAPSGSRGYGSNLDVRYLQGSEPNSVLPSTSNKQSVVLRDSTGNFTANIITANLTGKSTTSGTADQSIKLQTARNINTVAFDGTADITIYDKTKLPVNTVVSAGSFVVGVTYLILTLGTTDWVSIGVPASPAPAVGTIFVANGPGSGSGTANVVMISKLITKASTTTNANFNIPAGAAPSEPINGDIWSSTTTGTLFTRANSVTRQFAYLDSTITGNAANVTGVVAIANGGTGKATAADARLAMSLAKSGENSDITSLTGLTTALSTAQGGTGLTAPGANKNILISDGTNWSSAAPSGTWAISISGEAATSAKSIVPDTRTVTTKPDTYTSAGVYFDFKDGAKESLADAGEGYFGEMTFRKYGTGSDWTGGKAHQLGFTDNNNLHIRSGTSTTWGDWHKFLNSNNYNDYAPKKDGTGATGTGWAISITGSAASASSAGSASSLTNPRKINGVNFDGTANITIADDTKLPLAGGTLTGRVAQSTSGFQSAAVANIKNRLDSGFWSTNNPTVANGWPAPMPNPDGDTYYHLLSSTHGDNGNYFSMQLAADYYSNTLFYRSTGGSGTQAWSKILHSGNYTDYTPSKTGTGASGTWGINISGNAATATTTTGNAATATKLATPIKINGVSFDGTTDISVSGSGALSTAGGTMSGDITIYKPNPTIFFDDTNSEGGGIELAISVQNESFVIYEPDAGNEEWFRINDTSFNPPAGGAAGAYVRGKLILDQSNYTTYVPSKTGTGASGEWDIDISGNADTATTSGNADTATKLATARKINGVLFDGTKDISISIPTSALASDVYAWAKGENKPSYSYAEITGTKPSYTYSEIGGTAPAFNQNTTGNAATATKLATARKINGVLFDGSQDIIISIPTSATASDVYSWAKAATKPSYNYNEIGGTKPSYTYSEIGGTAPAFNQDTTGKSGDSTKWNGSTKFVQSTTPTSSVDGDIWFKV